MDIAIGQGESYLCSHEYSAVTIQGVYYIILIQCEPEVSGLDQCDSGTCKFALERESPFEVRSRELAALSCNGFI
jgi:hypothetical protein